MLMGRGDGSADVDGQAFFTRIEQSAKDIKNADTLEAKERLRMQLYPDAMEATGEEIKAEAGKQPLEQVGEYLQERAAQKNDVYCWPEESTYSSTVESASPFLVLARTDASADSFPSRIAGVKIIFWPLQAPEAI